MDTLFGLNPRLAWLLNADLVDQHTVREVEDIADEAVVDADPVAEVFGRKAREPELPPELGFQCRLQVQDRVIRRTEVSLSQSAASTPW